MYYFQITWGHFRACVGCSDVTWVKSSQVFPLAWYGAPGVELALKNGHQIWQFWIVTTPWEMLAGTNHMLYRCFLCPCLGIIQSLMFCISIFRNQGIVFRKNFKSQSHIQASRSQWHHLKSFYLIINQVAEIHRRFWVLSGFSFAILISQILRWWIRMGIYSVAVSPVMYFPLLARISALLYQRNLQCLNQLFHFCLHNLCFSGATELFNAMIHPLLTLPHSGWLWYQGKMYATSFRLRN